MTTSLRKLGLLLALCLTSVSTVSAHDPEAQLPFDRAHDHETLETHTHLGWESRYFSEGRDNLSGDSLCVSSFEIAWQHLALGVWYGNSPDQSYDELQLSIAVSRNFGDFKVYGAYTHLRFPFDGSHDNEVGAGVTWTGLPNEVELSADVYYSFDAEGAFAEIAASRTFELNDQLSLNLSLPFGINQGYVPDGHDGANHLALRLGLEYAVSHTFSLAAHAAQSWALDRDAVLAGDNSLIDFSHLGFGLQWSF
ncbi:MAG: hypothetical protein ACON5H_01780 [Akkermansiaceae bacterium]